MSDGQKRYGVPYQGSKNGIAARIVDAMPGAETFVDLFAGGCAVTHAAMESGKYRRFIANDMDWRGVTLFRDAINGKYRNERRVIDREYFEANKDKDAYVALCWSFGNNGRQYLWSDANAEYKLPACAMLMAETMEERRLHYMRFVKAVRDDLSRIKIDKHFGELQSLQRLQNLQRLQSLESLERLQRLQSLQSLQGLQGGLETLVGDYRAVEIPEGAVVYCDPPYRGTKGYFGNEFDHEGFYEWLRTRDFPVWVSEYGMPGDFYPVWGAVKNVLLSASCVGKAVERLWVHEKWRGKVWTNDLFH